MSIRYVWERSEIAYTYSHTDNGRNWRRSYSSARIPVSPINITYKTASLSSALSPTFSGTANKTDDIVIQSPSTTGTLSDNDTIQLPSNEFFQWRPSGFPEEFAVQAGSGGATLKVEQNVSSIQSDVTISATSGLVYELQCTRGAGTLVATVSNAASSTYPLNNNCCRIAKICVILPLLFWGYRHVK